MTFHYFLLVFFYCLVVVIRQEKLPFSVSAEIIHLSRNSHNIQDKKIRTVKKKQNYACSIRYGYTPLKGIIHLLANIHTHQQERKQSIYDS